MAKTLTVNVLITCLRKRGTGIPGPLRLSA